MKLVVGLGNPGKEYENTRHNVGFMIVDQYIKSVDWKNKFDGLYHVETINGEKVIFLKPQTFMNLSGNSVRKVVDFYHIEPNDILVIHDDLDLPFEKLRLKRNSSSGGHNGIKSIISSLGTDSFCRLKIGIDNGKKENTIDFVLSKFSKEELNYLEKNAKLYSDIIDSFLTKGLEQTMRHFN